jgi:hypothetical protein
MKVSAFPYQAPTGATEVPVVGQTHFLLSDLTAAFLGITIPTSWFNLVGTAFIGGDQSGNTRGAGALDVQSQRTASLDDSTPAPTAVASGDYSCAFGLNNTASGDGSVAVGTGTVASGMNTTAVGTGQLVGADFSCAFGYNNTVSGATSHTLGSENTVSGANATVLGAGNIVSGNYATVLGGSNYATGAYSFALGYGNGGVATTNLLGTQGAPFASGNYSTAVGFGNAVTTTYATAVGYGNYVGAGTYGLAIGNNNFSAGGIVIGNTSYVNSSSGLAIGFNCGTTGPNTMAIGFGAGARIAYGVNMCGPLYAQHVGGNATAFASNMFCYGATAEVVLMSDIVDFSQVGETYLTGFSSPYPMFFPTEVGVIITKISGVNTQPSVHFGSSNPAPIGGGGAIVAPEILLPATALTLLNGITTPTAGNAGFGYRQAFTPITTNGHANLSAGVTTGAALTTSWSSEMLGRFYWKGFLVESEQTLV